jgi:hypothetical protein
MPRLGRNPVIVAGETFASKAALERRCREMIGGYASGELVSSEHAMFLLSLIIERHDRPHEKILPGLEGEVIGIRVRHNDGYRFYGNSPTNVNHLFVAYENGMEIDFSWKKCCVGFKPEAIANSAMRRAIHGQVCEYKRLRFLSGSGSVTSDASGQPLTWGDSRVDHYPKTFAFLRDSFLEGAGVSLGDVQTRSDEQCGVAMQDEDLRDRWERYHDANKTLRLVSARENETSWREEGAIR